MILLITNAPCLEGTPAYRQAGTNHKNPPSPPFSKGGLGGFGLFSN